MKLKYYLRGLGTGIIFSAIIMLTAYLTTGGYKLTEEEIISRARDIGMVFENELATSGYADAVVTDKVTTEETTTEKMTTEETTTEETTTEETTTEETTENGGEYVTAEITVVGGMGSQQVAQMLEDADIIESAADFDSYLNKNGYSTKIEIGKFKINSGMTYEEIATILCTKQ